MKIDIEIINDLYTIFDCLYEYIDYIKKIHNLEKLNKDLENIKKDYIERITKLLSLVNEINNEK